MSLAYTRALTIQTPTLKKNESNGIPHPTPPIHTYPPSLEKVNTDLYDLTPELLDGGAGGKEKC